MHLIIKRYPPFFLSHPIKMLDKIVRFCIIKANDNRYQLAD